MYLIPDIVVQVKLYQSIIDLFAKFLKIKVLGRCNIYSEDIRDHKSKFCEQNKNQKKFN